MVNSLVERATSEMLIGSDWALNIEICDILNRDPGQVRDVVKGIKKRMGSRNPKTQILALALLETIIKNCGDIVHMHVAEKGLLHKMLSIVKKKPDIHVKEKILILIDTWQEAFGGARARYPQYYAAYQELLRAGAVFPQRSESSAPVFTPPQTHPLTSYPQNLRNADYQQEAGESSAEAELPSLSMAELQSARGIMDVLAEMLNALDPGNGEGLRQEVIVDLVDQCRTYKKRVVQLVNSTTDEGLLAHGLALNDDLQRLLAKHEAIATGTTPTQQAKPQTVDAPLLDMGDQSKQPDSRSTTSTTASSAAQPSLLSLPAPPTTNGTAPLVKLDPKIDLLSGDDFSSPNMDNALAVVPQGEPKPTTSTESQQNALVLADFYSQSNNASDPFNAQSSYSAAQTQSLTPEFYQQQHLQSSQPMGYSNGSASNVGQPQHQQSMYVPGTNPAWGGQVPQQQQPILSGAPNNGTLPLPPWESPTESSEPGVGQYPQGQVSQTPNPYQLQNGMHPQGLQSAGNAQITAGMYTQPNVGGYQSSMANQSFQNNEGQVSQTPNPYQLQNGMHPQGLQLAGNAQVTAGMYTQPNVGGYQSSMANQSFQNNQFASYPQPIQGGSFAGMFPQHMPAGQMTSMYPQQTYGYQTAGYGYGNGNGYGYGQQQDPRLLQQQMYGLSMQDNSAQRNSHEASTPSYITPSKPKKPEDKLFGDLVDISKFKPAKPTPG